MEKKYIKPTMQVFNVECSNCIALSDGENSIVSGTISSSEGIASKQGSNSFDDDEEDY